MSKKLDALFGKGFGGSITNPKKCTKKKCSKKKK